MRIVVETVIVKLDIDESITMSFYCYIESPVRLDLKKYV